MAEKRVKCAYPMSKFYIYKDEVPKGLRVSTPKDCEGCDECCEQSHCLIKEDKIKNLSIYFAEYRVKDYTKNETSTNVMKVVACFEKSEEEVKKGTLEYLESRVDTSNIKVEIVFFCKEHFYDREIIYLEK